MNQDNKISSVRPGIINKDRGLDLYVLLYYRGLRSVDDIYRLQSVLPKITASPVCTAIKTTSVALNYVFHFHRALKFRLCIFLNVPASGGLRPRTPCRGLAPGPHWGLPSPRLPDLPPPPTPPSRSAPVWRSAFQLFK